MPPETEQREESRAALHMGVAVQTGVEVTCTLKATKPARRLEVPDMAFSHGSAVVLPSIPPAKSPEPATQTEFANTALWQDLEGALADVATKLKGPFLPPNLGPAREPGLPLVLATLQFLKDNADHKLVVAGHADTTGSDAVNEKLSAARAKAVVALLEGKRDDWLKAVKEWNADEDARVVVAWAASARAWPCHPAQCKDVKAAVREFQRAYNRELEPRIGVDGLVGPQTRGAWFDVYEAFLEQRAGGKDALATLRGNLRWVSDDVKALPCGERYPLEKPGQDGYRSKLNRRVEVLLFATADVPDLTLADPPAVVYTGDYVFETLEPTVTPPSGADEELPEPDIAPVTDDDGDGVQEQALVTTMPVRPHADASDPWCFLEPFDQGFPKHKQSRQSSEELLA